MKSNQLVKVHIAQTITVSQAKGTALEVPSHTTHSSPGHRCLACLGHRYRPAIFTVAVVKLDRRKIAEPHRNVLHARFVIEKEIFDDVALITETQHELVEPVM